MPMLTRRAVLASFSTAAVAASLGSRRVFPAPAIVQAEITPEMFGATGGDPEADTRAWNLAIEQAAGTGRPVLAHGTYVLRVPQESAWHWGFHRSARAHVAVNLRSGTKIHGKEAQILVGAPQGPAAGRDERHFLFATGKNLAAGSLRDISFEGLTFDFRDEFGPIHGFTYAIGVIGVDGFARRNLVIRSSGARVGRGLLSENVRGRRDRDLRHENIVQGIFVRYEHDVAMRDISFDGFNEALDFDGPCWDVALSHLRFRDGKHEAQCIDTGGGSNWTVEDIVAEDTGPIVYVYIKANARPTYGEWINSEGVFTPDYAAPTNMTFRNVVGRRAGWPRRKGEAVRIGTYRTRHWARRVPAGGRSPRDITLENWTLEGCGQIAVNDCENLTLRDITISDPATLDDREAGAALVLREPLARFGGAVTGTVSNVVIRNPDRMGVSVVAGPDLSLDNITVDGQSPAEDAMIRVRPRSRGGRAARLGKVDLRNPRRDGIGLDIEER